MASPKIQNMEVIRRAEKSENREFNMEKLDINNLSFPHDKELVFVLGGNDTIRPEANNGNAKAFKSLISAKKQDHSEVYSFMYKSEPLKTSGSLMISEEYQKDAELLYKKSFEPMLFDSKGNIKSKKGIEQAFSNKVFVSHCCGANFVNIIINGFYDTLTKYYPQNTAEQLISKIRYFTYAPNELLQHNVTAFCVMPYNDSSFSWAKGLDLAEFTAPDIDFPKGSIKKLLKAKKQYSLRKAFSAAFNETRAIMFKVGQATYFIPSALNPKTNLGDHSFEYITKSQFLTGNTEFAQTARLANFASKVYMNEFLKNGAIDLKGTFNQIAHAVEEYSSSEQRE